MMNTWLKNAILYPVVFLSLVFVYNEYLIYWRYLSRCEWPQTPEVQDESIVKMIVLSDTHLLGSLRGHWFDKLRREWQQRRAFQTALSLFRPDFAVITGDLTDEGKWCSDREWEYYERRARDVFHTGKDTELLVVVGNHDIGFHYDMNENKIERFNRSFKFNYVSLYQPAKFPNINFVIVNSMALENDRCRFCDAAQADLMEVNRTLACLKQFTAGLVNESMCGGYREQFKDGRVYSQPILFNHYPLHRDSDNNCPNDADSEQAILKRLSSNYFQQNYDCMSHQSTKQLLSTVNPRLVFDGHTHYSCFNTWHGVPEYTLASFSWRNILIPSFLLVKLTDKEHFVSKCYLPPESAVISNYIATGLFLVLYLAMVVAYRFRLLNATFKTFVGRTLSRKLH